MIFNSIEFIYYYLPTTWVVYFFLNRMGQAELGKYWLVLASLIFYGLGDRWDVVLILGSIAVNFNIGKALVERGPKPLGPLVGGILFNIFALGYFKYTNFFLTNFNLLFSTDVDQLEIIFPVAISFFTFQQIAYLIDCYKGSIRETSLIDYCLFVTYFPKLLAGPIVSYQEIIPQLRTAGFKFANFRNLATGLVLIVLGLFKKTVLADSLTVLVDRGFSSPELNFLQAWSVSLAYTMKLYFDFSGYTDMALGVSRMFNIELPRNFNSPYRAEDIRDFWRRWHITLGRWLRDYVYIPLGGGRVSFIRLQFNLFITFFIVGIWHGAAWTYIAWGLMHGAAMIIHRVWILLKREVPRHLAIFLTFLFVNATWVVFRAEDFTMAKKVYRGMVGLNGVGFNIASWTGNGGLFSTFIWMVHDYMANLEKLGAKVGTVTILFLGFLVSFWPRNSMQFADQFRFNWVWDISILVMALLGLSMMGAEEKFIYFRF